MKRRITELEKSLIDKGFRLDRKIYTGLHSEHTLSYIYKGSVCINDEYNTHISVEITLDKTRKEIIDYNLYNLYFFQNRLSGDDINDIYEWKKSVETFINSLGVSNESSD